MQQKLDFRFLYRGVNAELYRAAKAKLSPKAPGQEFKRHIYWGEEVYWGDGSVFGESETNAVIMHQRDSGKYPTSGISTTPVFENAVRYATHDGKYPSGYVYKIDVKLFDLYGVKAFSIDQYALRPAIPSDQEVILVASDLGAIPENVIVEIIEVTSPSP